MILRCEWCYQVFERPNSLGPIPKYCKQAHRQRAYENQQIWKAIEEDRK